MKRPLKDRIWFYKPQLHWYGWKTFIPFQTGGDEWNWHTILIGWSITGRIVFATRLCPGTGKCFYDTNLFKPPVWPEDPYADTDHDSLFIEEA